MFPLYSARCGSIAEKVRNDFGLPFRPSLLSLFLRPARMTLPDSQPLRFQPAEYRVAVVRIAGVRHVRIKNLNTHNECKKLMSAKLQLNGDE